MIKIPAARCRAGRGARALFLFISCMWMGPAAMGQSLCGEAPKDVPTLTQEQLKDDVEGKAELLTRFLGSGQLKGAVDTSRMELYKQHRNVDQHQIDMYFMWFSCRFIDKTFPTSDKLKAWLQVRSAFPFPPPPSLQIRNALYQYGELVAEVQGAVIDQAHGIVTFKGLRTSGKADPTREFQYHDWILNCPDFPTSPHNTFVSSYSGFVNRYSGVVAGPKCSIVRKTP